jgi:prolyl oligopeptidase PreP (S9A serine peptidase family)
MVYRWLEESDTGPIEGRPSGRERALEQENEKLKAKIGELTMQIDVLKKIEDWKRQQKNVVSSIITESNLAQFQRPAEPPVSLYRRTTTKGKSNR